MSTLTSMKCAAVLLPALVIGMPMANAGDEKRDDPRDSEKTTAVFPADRQETASPAIANNEFFETMPARGYHSDSLLGQEVKSRNDDNPIGEISNLLLDENGQIVAVILSVGGTLGMGERDVALAWNQIERRVDGDETTLWINQSEQSLKDAPKYSNETKHSGREQQRAEKRQDANRPEQPATASSRSSANKSDATTSNTSEVNNSQFLTTMPALGYHSDNLVGQEVTNRRNEESIGEVSDLVLDGNGQVIALIVSVGGVMGLGEREVAIAWDQVERKADGEEVTLSIDLTETSLKDAPKYSREQKKSRQ